MSKILTTAQAKAVYSAMCALNTVGADVAQYNLPERKQVFAFADGTFGVSLAGRTKEEYPNQSAFATAYGLNGGAPTSEEPSAPCTRDATCGWDESTKMGDKCRVCGATIPF